ncbi:putative acetyltransferase [Stackebrandtia albiflava]|uniref:Putative acetyltransferase n=1 Tax=Stackebrandtia albiflava TaxID=406432 RepID=A0A562VC65_9ACTN|nr:GNAT family N-acetyltransferase [Stackebrandtia albiflava]TWJ15448.1 putative acetyltransferase [Stackebrandtia albiflava]
MVTEFRPPRSDEMTAYYRVLPYANGYPSWEPADAAWHGGPEPWPPQRSPASAEQLETWATADLRDTAFHPIGAFVDGVCVGGSAMISFEVTVPGGGTVRMGGVTATGVVATHRRRGYLRRMMQAMFDAALERGEPLAMLSASEGSIYGRFGFSPATHRTRWELARHEAVLRPAEPDPGSLELVDAARAKEAWPPVHAEVRRNRVGELRPQPGRWDGLSDEPDGTNGPMRYLLHRDRHGHVDGVANFRLPWSPTAAHAGTLVVEALEATNPVAYRALWELLIDFDLTKTVVAAARPRDEPLRWMLTNPRAMRVTRQTDNLWARLLDVPRALTQRSYSTPGELKFTIDGDRMCPANNGTWQLRTTDDTAATCVPTDATPDMTITPAALGSLYFGGMSAHHLAYAGHVTPHTDGAVDALSRMFRTDPEPHNSFGF